MLVTSRSCRRCRFVVRRRGCCADADDRICIIIRLQAVLVPTEKFPETPEIKGHDFNTGRDIDSIMQSMFTTGFQATALGQAVNEINRMVRPHEHCSECLEYFRMDGLAGTTPSYLNPDSRGPGCPPQIKWRLSDEPITPETDPDHVDPEFRAKTRTR